MPRVLLCRQIAARLLKSRRIILPTILIFSFAAFSAAQDPASGIQRFSTQLGGQYDSFDPATGNIMLTIPVMSKAGKIPFSYNLVGNFHAYIPEYDGGTSSVQVTSQISGKSPLSPSSVGYDTTISECYEGDTYVGEVYTQSGFSWVDATDAIHTFAQYSFQYGPGVYACGSYFSTPVTLPAADGSGYTLLMTPTDSNDSPTYSVYDRSGDRVTGAFTDPDGTQITNSGQWINGTTWAITYTDSLGMPVLTATAAGSHSGGPDAGNPDTYVYTGGDGTPQKVQVNYTYFPQRTNFGYPNPDLNNVQYSFNTNFATSIVMPDGETYQLSYEPTPGYPGDITGRLAKITLPGGGSISFAYSGPHNGFWGGGIDSATLTRTVDDGNGHVGVWTYVYSPPTDHYDNFIVTATDPAGNVTTYHFHGEYQTEETVQDPQGHVLSQTVTCYNGLDLRGSAVCVAPSTTDMLPGVPIYQTDVYSSPGTSPPYSLVETQYDYNSLSGVSNGDVLAVKRYDAGATYGPTGSPVSETDATYANVGGTTCGPVSQYIHDHPCVTKTVNSAGTLMSLTSYVYNAAGHPTQTSRMADSSHSLTSYASYNANGTIATSTDVNGAVTTYHYDGTGGCNNLLPTSVDYPLGLSTSQTWDCTGAVVTSSTDMNSNITHYFYDNLWRPTITTYPDGGETSIGYNLTSSPPNVTVSKLIDNTGRWLTTQTNLDGLFRPVRQILETDPAGPDYTDTTYNNLGQVYSVTNPYRSTNDPTYGITYYAYDALGRTTQITNPDGTTKLTTYSGRATEVQDEGNGTGANRVTRVYQSDGLGRLTSVCEVTSATQFGNGGTPSSCGQDIAGTGFLTSYGYDALGNLTSVTQNGLNGRSYFYDGLSRLTKEINPESGTTIYTYDSCSAGDLCTRVRPKANQGDPNNHTTTSYSYDAVHRMLTRSYDDSLTPNAYFSYDTCCWWGFSQTNTKGRLQEEWVGSACCATQGQIFGYDAMGRTVLNVQCTIINCASPTNPLNYTFDLAGDLTSSTNGYGWTYNYTYDNAERLSGITSTEVDSTHPGSLLSSVQYNPLEKPTSDVLGTGTSGNGVGEQYTYDNRGRTTYHSGGILGGPGNWGFESVGYAPNSDVTGMWASAFNGEWYATYDDFNRILSFSTNSAYYGTVNMSYVYDRFGNRWQQNVTAGSGPSPSYAFDGGNRTASFSYDAAGDVLNDGFHTYSYDAEGRMLTVDGGTTATYVYDASGRRVQKTTGSSTVYLAYTPGGQVEAEYTPSTVNRFEVYEPDSGRNLVTYSAGMTFFNLPDLTDSQQLKITQDGSYYESEVAFPYGDNRLGWGSGFGLAEPNVFGDLDTDSETGLSHALFRQYNPTQGRWMTPDPAGMAAADPANPQSWNRYTYVMNNPLNATDPLGLCYFGDGATIGVSGPRNPGLECGTGALDSSNPGGCMTDASCSGTPIGPSHDDPAGTADSFLNQSIAQNTADAEGSYSSYVNAVEQTGGTYIRDGKTYTVGWSMGEGAFWTGPNGERLSAEDGAELGLPGLPHLAGLTASNSGFSYFGGNPAPAQRKSPQPPKSPQQPQPKPRTGCAKWNLANGLWGAWNLGLWAASATPAAPATAPVATVSTVANGISALGALAFCPL